MNSYLGFSRNVSKLLGGFVIRYAQRRNGALLEDIHHNYWARTRAVCLVHGGEKSVVILIAGDTISSSKDLIIKALRCWWLPVSATVSIGGFGTQRISELN